MADHDYKEGGWKEKYQIAKADGSPVDEGAMYFILRLDEDPHALIASIVYAMTLVGENDVFALDVFRRARGCLNVNETLYREVLRLTDMFGMSPLMEMLNAPEVASHAIVPTKGQ